MTHSIDAPLPPPATGTPSGGQSTTDVAKDEARNVGQTAAQAGSQVASTAADQARNVVQETQYQAQDLLQQGRTQLRQQAGTQQQKAAEGLSSLAQQLRGMADGSGDGAPGPARDLVQQASGKLEEFGGWLQNHEPADLLDEIRAYARRKPGTFLLGAALAGVVAGRLTTGVKAAHTGSGIVGCGSSGAGTARPQTTSANYVDPTPAYAGYGETGFDEQSTGYGTTPGTGYGTGYGATPGTTPGTGYGATSSTTPGAEAHGTPLPPPPYGTVPPEGSVVPPTTPAGWDDPARRPGEVG
jgi:hypothetical protein